MGALVIVICIHMLLNISLVGCKSKLTVLVFFLELAGRHFLKLNSRLKMLNICFNNLRLLTGTSLSVFFLTTFEKKPKNSYVQQYCLKV